MVKRFCIQFNSDQFFYGNEGIALFASEADAVKYAERQDWSFMLVSPCYVKREIAKRRTLIIE